MKNTIKRRLVQAGSFFLLVFFALSVILAGQGAIGGMEVSAASKESAEKAYASFLAKHLAKDFGDSFYTADFQPKDKTYVNEYCLVDIDKDKQPELITRTNVNFRWFIIRVYEYKDGKVKNYKFKSGSNAVFNDRATAAGAYQFSMCKKGHIHNAWLGGIYGSSENIYNISNGRLRKYLSRTVEVSGTEKATKYGKKTTIKNYEKLTSECEEKALSWQANTKANRNKLRES